MNGEPVLVTGGAGYIGSHVCKQLWSQGYLPVTYDSFVTGHSWAVKWGPLEVGDIRDDEKLLAAIERYRPSAVMHLAALSDVAQSGDRPDEYYAVNVGGTLTLLKAMRRNEIRKLIFSSTCAIYGQPSALPITEKTDKRPINVYGRSKWMMEQVVEDHAKRHALKAIALRYFNAVGADAEGEIGEAHDPENHLLPRLIEAARGHGGAVLINGTDYDTHDGTCVRDYLHVDDIAAAHFAALGLETDMPFLAMNLGTGGGWSVREMIAAVERVAGASIDVGEGPRRVGDAAELVADAGHARQILSWQPAYRDLDMMVQTAWNWHVNRESP